MAKAWQAGGAARRAEFARSSTSCARCARPAAAPGIASRRSQSLRRFVLEETYEVLDAIDRDDPRRCARRSATWSSRRVFLAQIEAESGRFTIADSSRGRRQARAPPPARLRRRARRGAAEARRPGARAVGSDQGARARRRPASRRTVLERHPRALPALLRAYEIGSARPRSASTGRRPSDVVAKIEEEVAELRDALAGEGRERAEEEMGDLLFAIANLARKLGIEPEARCARPTRSSRHASRRRSPPRGARAIRARSDARGDGSGVAQVKDDGR